MINQEEYKVLRNYFFRGIRWISRDKNGNLVVSKIRPDKFERKWLPQCPDEDWGELRNSETYPFSSIQWKDEEPCDIAELIDEYEREEIKVKKNLEWLKEEVLGLKKNGSTESNQTEAEKEMGRLQKWAWDNCVDRVYDLIDQLDEPEVTLNRAFEKVSEIYPMTKGEVCRHLERVVAHGGKVTYGEQEVLSQEWIDEHAVAVTYDGIPDETEIVYVDELENLLIPKKELPVVPKYVAEYLELAKSEVSLMRALEIANRRDELPKFKKENVWISSNDETFARAWLDGYTVGDDPLYRARLKEITGEYIASYLRAQFSGDEDRLKELEIGNKYTHENYRHLSEFTENELKKLGIWDSDQWEIEEVEE